MEAITKFQMREVNLIVWIQKKWDLVLNCWFFTCKIVFNFQFVKIWRNFRLFVNNFWIALHFCHHDSSLGRNQHEIVPQNIGCLRYQRFFQFSVEMVDKKFQKFLSKLSIFLFLQGFYQNTGPIGGFTRRKLTPHLLDPFFIKLKELAKLHLALPLIIWCPRLASCMCC